MKSYHFLLTLLLCTYITRAVGQCSSNEPIDNTIVSWQCGEDQAQNVSCSSLSDALDFSANRTAMCPNNINVTIYLNSEETLEHSSTGRLITNMSHFRLVGINCSRKVECKNDTALMFEGNEMNVEIQNVHFHKCGNGKTALSFSGRMDVTLCQVVVSSSSGAGLSFENISGQVAVSNSSFVDNTINEGYGAGVRIATEQLPGQHPTAEFVFRYCRFIRNKNCDHKEKTRKEVDGGGMYITVKGFTKNIAVQVLFCHFINNNAKWGAGLFIGFYQTSSNNQVTVNGTSFRGNNYSRTIDTKYVYNAGGGALATTTGNSSLNNVTFENCTFSENLATWGGGLALYAAPDKTVEVDQLNKYFIINCTFLKNTAAIGSAVNIYCKSVASAPEFCNAIPYIRGNNIFADNGQKISKVQNPSASTFDINGFSTHVRSEANLSFSRNTGTPLSIRTTALVIEKQVTMAFNSNTGETGGGIALYDSWMSLELGCKFTFTNNSAFAEGGAIYAQQSADLYVPHVHNCFLRFINTTIPPWNWDCKFVFSGNRVSTRTNSIYATSVIPCEWTNATGNTTFCWKDWQYDSNCSDQIATSVRNFSTTPDSVTLSPGIPKLFVKGVDDLGHEVTNLSLVPTLWPQSSTDIQVKHSDDGLTVNANRYTSNISILIQFDGDRNIFKVVSVDIGGCPPGFYFSNAPKKCCMCYENMRNALQCHGRSWTASLLSGFCMTYSKIKGKMQTVYGRCVFSHAQRNSNVMYIALPGDEKKLNSGFCGLFNRTGLLCGECEKGHSIDVFSATYNCKKCSSSWKSWTIFITVNGLPPLALFLAILTFHFSFTSGALNGFIFFSHVVTLSQETMVIAAIANTQLKNSKKIFLDILVDFYSFWSLDNYRIYHSLSNDHPVCLGEQLRVIDVLALHYLSALYPFLLIVIAYIVIELHARNCRVLVWLWKPLCFACTRFRQSWKMQTSVVDAFASFVLLSYVKLVRISLLLLTYTNVAKLGEEELKHVFKVNNYDPTVVYFSRQHIPFVFLGGVFLITFGILPPLLLLFYQCKSVQRCLNRCRMNRIGLKTFIDVFQGCYKDGRNGGPDRRFFAGLYLIFRVVIFCIFNLQDDHTISYYCLVIFCIVIMCLQAWLQPYKVKFYNNLDVFFTAILAAFFGLHILGFSYLETTLSVPFGIIFVGTWLAIIPVLYLVGLVFLKALRRCCNFDLVKTLGSRISTSVVHHQNQETRLCREQSLSQGVTYSEIDPRQLVDSTLYEGEKAPEDDGLLSRGRESGYGSVNH